MELPSWLPAFIVSIIHLFWITGWWIVGHIIYLLIFSCTNDEIKECYFMNFASKDFIALISVLVGSTLYFRIAQYVMNALYKQELPGGQSLNLDKLVSKVVNSSQLNRQQRRAMKKK